MQKSFPSVLPKRVYQVPLRMYSKLSQRKPVKHKETSRYKTFKRIAIAFSQKNHLEANRRRSGIRKGVTTHKKIPLPSLTMCFEMEQFVLVPAYV